MQLQIPQPCSKDWDLMIPQGDGRFCNSCQHTVVDFSNMTDNELLSYLQKNPFTHCVHVRNNQLNRTLTWSKQVRQKFLLVKAKMAAMLLFLLSPNAIFSKVSSSHTIQTEQALQTETDTSLAIMLSGLILNQEEIPFSGVKVLFDDVLVATTNSDGKFSFIPDTSVAQHRIQFKAKEGRFVTESYHNRMGSRYFEVKIDTTFRMYASAGMPLRPFIEDIYSEFLFLKNNTKLNAESATIINNLCIALRRNPFVSLHITLTYTKDKTKALALQRKDILTTAFVDKNGIDIERLKFELRQETKMNDKVILSSSDK